MSDNNPKAAEPMDPHAKEGKSPERVTRAVRNAYALDTLVAEVETVFGEAVVTYGEADEWQVVHEVTFETDPDAETANLAEVLTTIVVDPRIASVTSDEDQVLVEFKTKRGTRDDRDGFGLAEVVAVYLEDDLDRAGDTEPAEPVYLSNATGNPVTPGYAKANPDKVTVQE